MDPQNRRLRVLSIGAGVSGILMAYQIQKMCENVEHVIYEKNEDIAGKQWWKTFRLERWPLKSFRYLVREQIPRVGGLLPEGE